MNDLIREFLVWSVGFVIVSAMTLLAGHLLARRARKDSSADVNAANVPKRRPAWGTALIVVFAYLLLLGPVLQGVSRTFRADQTETEGVVGPASETSAQPNGAPLNSAMLSVPDDRAETTGDSAECPCRSQQQETVEVSTESIERQQESATIESRGLVKSKSR